MGKTIVYFQQEFPKLTETFVLAEILELYRRSYDIWVVVLRSNRQLLPEGGFRERIIEVGEEGAPEEIFKRTIAEISDRSPDYLHAHWVTEAKRLLSPMAEHLGVPFGFTCHAADIWLRGNRLEPEELGALGSSSLCVTAAVEGSRHKEYLRWCGVPEEKIIVTPNSVDSRNLPGIRTTPPDSVRRLVAVGRPVPKKGFFVAVDAVRLLRLSGYEATLELIGGGDLATELGAVLDSYVSEFPFIEVSGLRPHAEVLSRIRNSDALLMPSMVALDGDSDGIPTVLSEAMLMGVPVIATDVGSITDLVRPGETGFIARPGDSASLAEAVVSLNELLQDKARAGQMLGLAKQHAQRHETQWSVNVLAQHLEHSLGRF